MKDDRSTHRVKIPQYTRGEELINSISHAAGAAFAVLALVLCVIKAAAARAIVSVAVYGSTLVLLYVNSTVYHALRPNKGKRVMRVIDHCSIYLLIAGTYTPFTLVSLAGATGWVLFGIVWGAAVLGTVLSAIDLERFKVAEIISYLAMGWVIIAAFKPLTAAVAPSGVVLLVCGGVVYTLGAVLYGLGGKKRYLHSLFHFFVLGGSVLHFLAVYLFVL
ncbi:MAG: hemolysin III family protein [Clostridia bacterium]|nr:hemolysin III family protein [Clostridia bacterium]